MSESTLVDELAARLRDAPLSEVDAVVSALLVWSRERPPDEGLERLRLWRDRIEIARSQIVADQQAAGIEGPRLDGLLGRATTTRSDRNKAKKRAATIGRNPALAQEVETGALTAEQLDAICDADAKTDGKAATDQGLHDSIAAAPADAARKTADEFVKAQLTDDDLEKRRRHQRKQRCARKGTTADGLASLTICGDDESVHEMWAAIIDTADAMYRADGGRAVAANEHRRSDHQRRFDAAHRHLTAGIDGQASGVRPVIVVTAARLAGCADAPAAEMIGTGPIPDSLLEEVACGSDFVGMVFDADGEVLWQGRKRRHATKAQQLALIARDRGCVLCGTDPQRCQAHHLMPWSAPARGRTDIDQLALLCGTCHRYLHERNHTLYRSPDGRWKTRPATPNETPRRRPSGPDRRPVSPSRRDRKGSRPNDAPRRAEVVL